MPRLLLVLLLLGAPPDSEAPQSLPEGLQATRVSGGVVQLQTLDGASLPGDVAVGPGWYFTAYGYETLMQGRAELEVRVVEARAQLDAHRQVAAGLEVQLQKAVLKAEGCGPLAAATCAAAAANAAGYSPQAVYLIACICLVLGLAVGLLILLLERLRRMGGSTE